MPDEMKYADMMLTFGQGYFPMLELPIVTGRGIARVRVKRDRYDKMTSDEKREFNNYWSVKLENEKEAPKCQTK